MELEYEVLEDTHETSVYQGNELIALFFDRTGNTNGVERAKRLVSEGVLPYVCAGCTNTVEVRY